MAHLDLTWFNSTKLDARQRTARNPLVIGCKRGDKNFLRALMVMFWEFVDDFPEILFERFSVVSEKQIRRQAKYFAGLAGIVSDEKCHRSMWLATSEVLNLTYQALESYRGKFLSVSALSRHLREQTHFGIMLLRVVGVEVVAEMLSTELLSAKEFSNALVEEGRIWFKVHVVHEGTMHEQIALRLALKELAQESNVQKIVADEVLCVVDLFDRAAREAVLVAQEFAAMGMAA